MIDYPEFYRTVYKGERVTPKPVVHHSWWSLLPTPKNFGKKPTEKEN